MKSIDEYTLGERIAFFRNELGMSQNDLALILHMTRQAVSNYECDKREPTPGILRSLAEIFNISLDMLITGREFKK